MLRPLLCRLNTDIANFRLRKWGLKGPQSLILCTNFNITSCSWDIAGNSKRISACSCGLVCTQLFVENWRHFLEAGQIRPNILFRLNSQSIHRQDSQMKVRDNTKPDSVTVSLFQRSSLYRQLQYRAALQQTFTVSLALPYRNVLKWHLQYTAVQSFHFINKLISIYKGFDIHWSNWKCVQ